MKDPKLEVKPRFASIKQEAVESGKIPERMFEKNVVEKAAALLKGKKGRGMLSGPDNGYGFSRGRVLQPKHLHSLLLYTDFTDFCTEFARTVRVDTEVEDVDSVNKRHAPYFHISKAMREAIDLFGTSCNGRLNGYPSDRKRRDEESGPFWCGLKCVINVPQFAISFNGPTSTTKTKEIAVRFAGERGMIMVMNNKEESAKFEKFINVKWLSAFPEEDERLFMGSNYYLTVESLIVIQTGKNYRLSIKAYSKLDQVLKGGGRDVYMDSDEVDALFAAMESVRGRGTEWKRSNHLDQFAVDNFYLFALKKTEIDLNLWCIKQIFNQSFVELLFYSAPRMSWKDGKWSFDYEVKGPDDTTHVLRGDLIQLFPNLSSIIINNSSPFSVSRLLDELSAVDLPRSLSTIKIDDRRAYGFLRKSVDTNLKQKAAAMNMTLELKEGTSGFGKTGFLTIGIHH